MDALERLERIAEDRDWVLRFEYDTKPGISTWQLEFGPRGDPLRMHLVRESLLEDCADLMLDQIVRVGLDNMAGEED